MLCIHENKIKIYTIQQIQELYQYNSVIISAFNVNYIVLLDNDFKIIKSFLHIGTVNLVSSKIKHHIFTNNSKYYNCYIHYTKPQKFQTVDEYKLFLVEKTNSFRITNILNYSMFSQLDLSSKSQMINIQLIHMWVHQNKYVLKSCIEEPYIRYYDFFNYVLYMMSRSSLTVTDRALSQIFKVESPAQRLSIDLGQNRPTTKGGINYLNLRGGDSRLSLLKASKGMWLLRFDYTASYLQLLCHMLDIKFPQNDIYLELGRQLGMPETVSRDSIKQRVFKILFSQEIKQHLDNQFFASMYQFSVYLWQQHVKVGYVNSLISDKKIRVLAGEKNSRSKLFNAVIMNLQFELYVGILFQLLQYKKDKIIPIIFVYDSIILQIDCDAYLSMIQEIQSLITYDGKFKITRQLGKNLQQMQEI